MTNSKHINKEHSAIIDRLGGTGAVARLFEVSDPTVSIWRKTQIPKARMMYIKLAYPSVIEGDSIRKVFR